VVTATQTFASEHAVWHESVVRFLGRTYFPMEGGLEYFRADYETFLPTIEFHMSKYGISIEGDRMVGEPQEFAAERRAS